ncbi:MAG: acetylornithine deacetylase [Pseudomonadota bacterium]
MPQTAIERRAVEILETLIGYDSVSTKPNRPLIDWIADYLYGYGVDPFVQPNEGGDKANLYATIGPDQEGGIVLSGHTDVVPVADQAWQSDPFCLRIQGDRLYGRGTADMKGFVALALALVPELVERHLHTPVHLAFSYDEEVGCLGIPHLVDHILRHLPTPKLAIIGEPTMMRPVNAHKGVQTYRTVVTGKDAHSSLSHHGANAIVAAAEFVAVLNDTACSLEQKADPRSGFDPPWSTLNIGVIDGGTALNIIPKRCEVSWDYRSMPGEDPTVTLAPIWEAVETRILPNLRDRYPEASIETEQLCNVPGLTPDPDGAAETLARGLTGANEAGTVPFGTEAGVFQQAGISAVVIGPGDIAQAHKPDEYLTLKQLSAGAAFLAKIAEVATNGYAAP